MRVNEPAGALDPYPLEQLGRWRAEAVARGLPVFDFGAGDPVLPTWPPVRDALREALPEVSRYPSIQGTEELREAQTDYLRRRFGFDRAAAPLVIPSLGSREAIFHIGLCLAGRSGGRKKFLCPDPGYPVYGASAVFAGGVAVPVTLRPENGYRLEPWTLPEAVVRDAAAVWVNYPNNPTTAVVDAAYWERLAAWGRARDVVILSDECYVDIYDASLDDEGRERPPSALGAGPDGVVSFFSLSKRSGMTGYRAGFAAGDPEILVPYLRARSYFGVASPQFIDSAARVAWRDEEHARARRREFTRRLSLWFPVFRELGLVDAPPRATFYLWCRVPGRFRGDDLAFCRELASRGVLSTPSRWFGSGTGHARFAMTAEDAGFEAAAEIIREVAEG